MSVHSVLGPDSDADERNERFREFLGFQTNIGTGDLAMSNIC